MKLDLKNKTILVVEDYPVMRKAMKNMLATLGAQYIFEADNGRVAITTMKKRKYDIVLCDYDLGEGRTGQQVLEEARHKKLISFNTIFIIVSAHQSASFVLSSIENKPDEYLAKPFNPQQLSIRLKNSAARKKYLYIIEKEIEKGNLARAIYHCDALLSDNQHAMRSYLLKIRADLAIKVGDFKKASIIYQQILEQRDLPWARMGAGIVAYYQADYETAINILEQLVSEKPMLMECYDWLARSYELLEQLDQAEKILSQATEISPQSFSRQKKLAALADRTGHIDIAEKAYLAVTQLGQYSIHKSPGDYSGLAKVYAKKNEQEQALKSLDKLRKNFINNPEADLRASTLETEIHKKKGNTELSELAFRRVKTLQLQLQDKTPFDLQLDVAKACYLNHDTETADSIINALVQNHIDDNGLMDDIRRMHSDIGNHNHSEVLIQQTKQKLMQINNQGVQLFKEGQFEDALAVFEEAVEKMPKNKAILLNMAKISLHDLKTAGVTEEKLLLTQRYIQQAKEAGIGSDKLGTVLLEFEKITNTPPSLV